MRTVTTLTDTLRHRLRARRHTALLVAIVAAFAVRPLIGDSGAAPVVFSLALLVVMLIALFTIQVDDLTGERKALLAQRRRRYLVGWALAVPAVAERLLLFLAPRSWLVTVGAVSWLSFIAFVAWSQLRSVMRQKEITGETISSSASVYLLFGLAWGLLYAVIFQFQPGAFGFGAAPQPDRHQVFEIFVYFSLTTLSTIGFGDITPISVQARYAAVAEGITGQFYLAILVARLVGMQMSRAASGPPRDES
jgi:hypothetical protein